MVQYNAPAKVDDFSEGRQPQTLATEWHEKVSGWIRDASESTDGEQRSFFDALGSTATPLDITWDAFPLAIRHWFGNTGIAAQTAAETPKPLRRFGQPLRAVRNGALAENLELFHRQQDEYCEWFTHRDDAGQITRIDFTSEGPEYWEHLGTDQDLCVSLYRKYLDPPVSDDELAIDLFWQHDVADTGLGSDTGQLFRFIRWQKNDYNPYNKWNTTHGVMHLTHPANTLGAEVNLASDATVLRKSGAGNLINDIHELACCARFGEVNRSSDPGIGFGVNQLVQQGNRVALADPVGLYISRFNEDGVVDDNGDPAGEWTVVRGHAHSDADPFARILRATFTPPADGDVTVGGIPLRFGGQVALHIKMVLYGIAEPNPAGLAQASGCVGKCCEHPDRADLSGAFDLEQDCGDVNWTRWEAANAPFPRDEQAGPGLAAAGGIGAAPEPELRAAAPDALRYDRRM